MPETQGITIVCGMARFIQASVWIDQARLTALYGTTPQNITQHVRALFAEAKQDPEVAGKDHSQVQTEDWRRIARAAKHYNLTTCALNQ